MSEFIMSVRLNLKVKTVEDDPAAIEEALDIFKRSLNCLEHGGAKVLEYDTINIVEVPKCGKTG